MKNSKINTKVSKSVTLIAAYFGSPKIGTEYKQLNVKTKKWVSTCGDVISDTDMKQAINEGYFKENVDYSMIGKLIWYKTGLKTEICKIVKIVDMYGSKQFLVVIVKNPNFSFYIEVGTVLSFVKPYFFIDSNGKLHQDFLNDSEHRHTNRIEYGNFFETKDFAYSATIHYDSMNGEMNTIEKTLQIEGIKVIKWFPKGLPIGTILKPISDCVFQHESPNGSFILDISNIDAKFFEIIYKDNLIGEYARLNDSKTVYQIVEKTGSKYPKYVLKPVHSKDREIRKSKNDFHTVVKYWYVNSEFKLVEDFYNGDKNDMSYKSSVGNLFHIKPNSVTITINGMVTTKMFS